MKFQVYRRFYAACLLGQIFLPLLLTSACSRHFVDEGACRDFVKNSAGNAEKLYVGAAACYRLSLINQSADDKAIANTSQCVLDKFNLIKDDASGTQVVTECAESNNAVNFGRALAMKFSASARMAEQIRLQQEQISQELRDQEQRARFRELTSPTTPAAPTEIRTLQIDGRRRLCTQIGDSLSRN